MSLLKMLQDAQGGEGLAQLATQLNLDRDQVNGLAGMLAPALGMAAKKKAGTGGLDSLLGAVRGQANADLYDEPARAAAPAGQAQGMEFLKTLLGGESEANELASEAATRSGVDPSVVMQLLPALAAMVQGGLQKKVPDSELDAVAGQQEGGIGGLLGGALGGLMGGGGGLPDMGELGRILDADGDGSPLDDVLGRFMK